MSFAARLEGAQLMTGLLSCLIDSKKKEQPAHWLIDNFATRIYVVGQSKTTSTTLTFPRSYFTNFALRDEHGLESTDAEALTFSLDLVALCDCLQLFGTSMADARAITLTYEQADAVLKLTLEEQGVFTCCDVHVLEIATDVDSATDMRAAYHADAEVARLIANSAALKDAVADFEETITGASAIRLEFSIDPPLLRLSAAGGIGAVSANSL